MAEYVRVDNLEVSDYVTVWDCNCSEYGKQTVMAVDDLQYLPTADVVEVVRCKNCVYRMELHPMYAYEDRSCKVCFIRNKPVSDNGYCSDAIRKEAEK